MSDLNLDDFAPSVYWDEAGNLHAVNPLFPLMLHEAMSRIADLERENERLRQMCESQTAQINALSAYILAPVDTAAANGAK